MFKILVILFLATLAIAENAPHCAGCPQTFDADGIKKAETTLNNSLTKLTAGEGPVYKLAKINSATSQVVQGFLYKINADLIDEKEKTKTCDIEIIEFKDVTISFNCPGEDKVTKKHSV